MPALCRVHRIAAHLDRQDPEIQAARNGEGGVVVARATLRTDRKQHT
jgi:hypothetical protein